MRMIVVSPEGARTLRRGDGARDRSCAPRRFRERPLMSEPAPPSEFLPVRRKAPFLVFVIIRSRMKLFKRLIAGLALLVVAFVCGFLPYFLAGVATTRRFQFRDAENAGLTPASFQLPYEDLRFK